MASNKKTTFFFNKLCKVDGSIFQSDEIPHLYMGGILKQEKKDAICIHIPKTCVCSRAKENVKNVEKSKFSLKIIRKLKKDGVNLTEEEATEDWVTNEKVSPCRKIGRVQSSKFSSSKSAAKLYFLSTSSSSIS